MDKTRFNYLYVFVAILGVLLLHDAIVRYQFERNRALLEEGSRLLLEKETLSESDLERLFGRGIVAPGPDGEIPYAGTAASA